MSVELGSPLRKPGRLLRSLQDLLLPRQDQIHLLHLLPPLWIILPLYQQFQGHNLNGADRFTFHKLYDSFERVLRSQCIDVYLKDIYLVFHDNSPVSFPDSLLSAACQAMNRSPDSYNCIKNVLFFQPSGFNFTLL